MGVMLTLAYEVAIKDQQVALEIINQAHTMIQSKFQPALMSDNIQLDHAIHQQSILFADGMSAFLYYRLLQQAIYPIQINGGLGLSEDIAQSLTYSEQVLKEAQKMGEGYILYNANFFEDGLLNMQLINWQKIVRDQTPVARVLAFLYEIQAPVYVDGSMLTQDFLGEDLITLDHAKQALYADDEKLLSMADINFSARKTSNWLEVFDQVDKNKYFITGLFKKGYATAIANMTYMTRQNIDYHFRSGQFAFERDMLAAIVLQMDREIAALG